MSTILVVRKGVEACIGADTLAQFGHRNESAKYVANPSKITRVGLTYIATVGNCATDFVLRSYFKGRGSRSSFHDVDAIFETWRKLHKKMKDAYYLNPHESDRDEYESSQMEALIANGRGIFGVYSERSVQEYTRFFAFGSGSEYAMGAMHAAFDRLRSVKDIAQAGLDAAAEFDDGTGAPFEVHRIALRN